MVARKRTKIDKEEGETRSHDSTDCEVTCPEVATRGQLPAIVITCYSYLVCGKFSLEKIKGKGGRVKKGEQEKENER